MESGETTAYNFRFDPPTSELLTQLAKDGRTTRSQALRDMILGHAELWRAGVLHQQEALATLVDRVGRDGYLVIFVTADEHGNPDVTIAGYRRGEKKGFFEGLKGIGHVAGDKCHVFLDFGELAPEPVIAGVGDAVIRVPCTQLSLGPLSWPPDEHEILRLPLKLMLPEIEEDAAAPAAAEPETVES